MTVGERWARWNADASSRPWQQREFVADALNGVVRPHLRAPVRVPSPDACAVVVQILEECGVEPTTAIERLLRQLVATSHAIRDANDGFGQNFHLADAESHG